MAASFLGCGDPVHTGRRKEPPLFSVDQFNKIRDISWTNLACSTAGKLGKRSPTGWVISKSIARFRRPLG